MNIWKGAQKGLGAVVMFVFGTIPMRLQCEDAKIEAQIYGDVEATGRDIVRDMYRGAFWGQVSAAVAFTALGSALSFWPGPETVVVDSVRINSEVFYMHVLGVTMTLLAASVIAFHALIYRPQRIRAEKLVDSLDIGGAAQLARSTSVVSITGDFSGKLALAISSVLLVPTAVQLLETGTPPSHQALRVSAGLGAGLVLTMVVLTVVFRRHSGRAAEAGFTPAQAMYVRCQMTRWTFSGVIVVALALWFYTTLLYAS